jgi:hypothetical protein
MGIARRKSISIIKTRSHYIVPEIEKGEGTISLNHVNDPKAQERAVLMTERRLMGSGFGFVGYVIRIKDDRAGTNEVEVDFKP